MKIKNAVTISLVVFLLASCAPVVKATPTETTSPISTKTQTPIPTSTSTITSTPVSYIEGLSNIPLPDNDFIKQAINEIYLKVMGLSHEQVKIIYVENKGIDGKSFVTMLDSSTGVPLAVFTDDWEIATLKFFGGQNNIVMGTDTVENPSKSDLEVSRDFERATIQVGNEWFRNEPDKGKIDPSQAKATESLIRILKNEVGINDIVGHPIIAIYPDWLIDGNFTQDEMREIMRNRIEYEIKSHPDIQSWVVVNEPYLDCDCGREKDPFYRSWGNSYDYVIEAFEIARQIDPSIALIYNDSDNHRANGGTTQITRAIIQKLHERDLVDYVGMQMHFNQWGGVTDGKVDTITIANEIAFYKDLGVPVLITELTYEPTETELKMSSKEFNERLSGIFEQVLKVAIESGNVKGITFWGVTDKYINDINWYMIFDEQGQPKQSYYVVLKTLYEGIK